MIVVKRIVPVVMLCFPPLVLAQRGGHYQSQSAPMPTVQTGYPGFFDTHLAGAHQWVVDAPLLSVDYGVTRNLTVGTNLLAASLSLTGRPTGLASLRYRLYSDGALASVVTFYGGGYFASTSNRMLLVLITSSTSWTGRKFALTATGFAGKLDSRTSSHDSVLVSGAGLAVTGQWTFSRRGALLGTLVAVPLVNGQLDTRSMEVTARWDLDQSPINRIALRIMTEGRFGNWLLSAAVILNVVEPARPLPWLSAAWSY